MTQEECLQTKERQPMVRIALVTTYNPHATFIAEVAKRNWNILQSKERLALIFNKPPLVAYRRPKSLRDRHVSTKFRNGTTDNALIPRGCKPCERPKCSWCNKIISSQNSSLLNLLNFFIIIGKLYLWDCRRDQRYPDLQRFKVRLKMKYEIERFISLKNNINNDNFFKKKWIFSSNLLFN